MNKKIKLTMFIAIAFISVLAFNIAEAERPDCEWCMLNTLTEI